MSKYSRELKGIIAKQYVITEGS
ncbi:hypothetical protein VCRA2113O415_70189 [Vibrio crassostreae]|nr:hypothetical protein VCRA2113O415_70189 [Vibrio crassostreae]CAK2975390.1 hypothetical protein VCRA2113O420_70001 [Vibrio crassostreae]CAK3584523.1 hypothetical protein VCRA2121O436_70001 [Vibrio crassostreae]